ncbi:1514_t:CDS:1, partial [Dentiscutata heterogama]
KSISVLSKSSCSSSNSSSINNSSYSLIAVSQSVSKKVSLFSPSLASVSSEVEEITGTGLTEEEGCCD